MEIFATKVGGHYHALHVFNRIGFFVVDRKCEKLNMMEVLTKKTFSPGVIVVFYLLSSDVLFSIWDCCIIPQLHYNYVVFLASS